MRLRFLMSASTCAVVITSAAALAMAAPASANQVWVQSVGRASATAACPISDPADLAAGWSPWGPSWEQWSNDHQGGFVCSRSITWAYDTPVSIHPCTQVYVDQFVLLDPSGFIPNGTPVYSDAQCARYVFPADHQMGFAYTPAGQAAADLICQVGNADPAAIAITPQVDLWMCAESPPT